VITPLIFVPPIDCCDSECDPFRSLRGEILFFFPPNLVFPFFLSKPGPFSFSFSLFFFFRNSEETGNCFFSPLLNLPFFLDTIWRGTFRPLFFSAPLKVGAALFPQSVPFPFFFCQPSLFCPFVPSVGIAFPSPLFLSKLLRVFRCPRAKAHSRIFFSTCLPRLSVAPAPFVTRFHPCLVSRRKLLFPVCPFFFPR